MTELTTDKRDALHDYVEKQKRLARQHRPRKSHWRHLRDERTAQLRRYVKHKSFWRRCWAIIRNGLPA